jgi:hypothetical protein
LEMIYIFFCRLKLQRNTIASLRNNTQERISKYRKSQISSSNFLPVVFFVVLRLCFRQLNCLKRTARFALKHENKFSYLIKKGKRLKLTL